MSTHQTPPNIGLGTGRPANRLALEVTEHDVIRHQQAFCEVEEGRTPHELFDDLLATTETSFGILEKANLGWLLSQCLRSTEGAERLRRDLKAMPKSRQLPLYFAIALQRINRFQDSASVLEVVLQRSPEDNVARKYLANALMNTGRWAEGLREMELSRDKLPVIQKPYHADLSRLWQGQALDGKCLVVVGNGDRSDEIQLSRFLGVFRNLGVHKIGMVCKAELADLMRGITAIDRVDSGYFEPFDYFITLDSLLHRFRINAANIPLPPYVRCSARSVYRKKEQLNNQKPLLGICWRNSEASGFDECDLNYKIRANTIDSGLLEDHLTRAAKSYEIISFQPDVRPEEREILQRVGCRILDVSAFENYAGIAEWMSCLDHFVTVESPLAHLAGALGIEAHVMLPFSSDWKWMIQGNESQWYPGVNVHLKKSEACWQSCVEEVFASLIEPGHVTQAS